MDVTLFFQRLDAQVRQYSPDLLDAYLAALRHLIGSAQVSKLAQYMENGDVAGALEYVFSAAAMSAAFAKWKDAYRTGVIGTGRYFTGKIPAPAASKTTVAVAQFNYLDPRVVSAIKQYESKTLESIRTDLRAGLKAAAEDGLRRGVNPRQIARELKGVLGLAANQEAAVEAYAAKLRAGKLSALRYQLRDKRFDRTVRATFKAGKSLTPEQVDKMVAAYRQRFVAWQANTMTRTTMINAQRLGEKLSWDQAVADGRVNGDDLIITWHTKMDGRERRTHGDMNLKTRRYGEPWYVEGVGAQDYPGQDEYNCRCRESYKLRIKRASEL